MELDRSYTRGVSSEPREDAESSVEPGQILAPSAWE